ncbi:MAG TPA: hypothetical protein VFG45_02490 [Candidatus Nitrosocosmicus sp.]|nr:hypothetical protein [Candidatus Nitrosocosmicus sp.]
MQVRVDLSYVDYNDVFQFIESLKHEFPEVGEYLNRQKNLPENLVFYFDFNDSFSEFEKHVRKTVDSDKNLHYDVAVDSKEDNTLTLLKPDDLEQLGIFICEFCGAVSSSEEEKYIHERAHYFF